MADAVSKILLRTEFLPLRDVPVKVALRDDKSWLEGFLREGEHNEVTWELWRKNTVCMRGIEPGDRWRPYHGGSATTVEVYVPRTGKEVI